MHSYQKQTSVTSIDAPELRSSGADLNTNHIWVQASNPLRTLFPLGVSSKPLSLNLMCLPLREHGPALATAPGKFQNCSLGIRNFVTDPVPWREPSSHEGLWASPSSLCHGQRRDVSGSPYIQGPAQNLLCHFLISWPKLKESLTGTLKRLKFTPAFQSQ